MSESEEHYISTPEHHRESPLYVSWPDILDLSTLNRLHVVELLSEDLDGSHVERPILETGSASVFQFIYNQPNINMSAWGEEGSTLRRQADGLIKEASRYLDMRAVENNFTQFGDEMWASKLLLRPDDPAHRALDAILQHTPMGMHMLDMFDGSALDLIQKALLIEKDHPNHPDVKFMESVKFMIHHLTNLSSAHTAWNILEKYGLAMVKDRYAGHMLQPSKEEVIASLCDSIEKFDSNNAYRVNRIGAFKDRILLVQRSMLSAELVVISDDSVIEGNKYYVRFWKELEGVHKFILSTINRNYRVLPRSSIVLSYAELHESHLKDQPVQLDSQADFVIAYKLSALKLLDLFDTSNY